MLGTWDIKKLLGIIFVKLLISYSSENYSEINLKCEIANVWVDNNYIYEPFEDSAVNKYKISNRTSTYVAGNLKGSSGFNYDATLDLNMRVLKVNKKDRKTGISGGYTKNCN